MKTDTLVDGFNKAIIAFLTALLGDVAHDTKLYTDEEYQVIKKFIGNEINKLRGDRDEQKSKEG